MLLFNQTANQSKSSAENHPQVNKKIRIFTQKLPAQIPPDLQAAATPDSQESGWPKTAIYTTSSGSAPPRSRDRPTLCRVPAQAESAAKSKKIESGN